MPQLDILISFSQYYIFLLSFLLLKNKKKYLVKEVDFIYGAIIWLILNRAATEKMIFDKNVKKLQIFEENLNKKYSLCYITKIKNKLKNIVLKFKNYINKMNKEKKNIKIYFSSLFSSFYLYNFDNYFDKISNYFLLHFNIIEVLLHILCITVLTVRFYEVLYQKNLKKRDKKSSEGQKPAPSGQPDSDRRSILRHRLTIEDETSSLNWQDIVLGVAIIGVTLWGAYVFKVGFDSEVAKWPSEFAKSAAKALKQAANNAAAAKEAIILEALDKNGPPGNAYKDPALRKSLKQLFNMNDITVLQKNEFLYEAVTEKVLVYKELESIINSESFKTVASIAYKIPNSVGKFTRIILERALIEANLEQYNAMVAFSHHFSLIKYYQNVGFVSKHYSAFPIAYIQTDLLKFISVFNKLNEISKNSQK